jgi:hypothetical protein
MAKGWRRMKIRTGDFRVREGDKVSLHKLPMITDELLEFRKHLLK